MKKYGAAMISGLFALILGGIILAYSIASGSIDTMSFSNPYVMLGGMFIALGLTVLLVASSKE